MKKLIFLSLMSLCAFTVSAQSNYSSPGIPPGTTTFTPTFRYKPATPDSLAQIWQSITGNKWFRMSTGMDDIVFSAVNFKGAGTTSSKLDLNNSIIISGSATAGQGFFTGDITNTAHQSYFTKALVGSNGVTGAFSVSSKLGGGASINSITGSGAVHAISLPNLANPYFSPDSGAHNYPLLAVANFVGMTYDTTTYTLTATGGGSVTIPQVDSIALAKADSVKGTVETFYNADGALVTSGGYRNVYLSSNEIDFTGSAHNFIVYPSSNLGVGAAPGQSDLGYSLDVFQSGTLGMFQAGNLSVDNAGHAQTATLAAKDSSTAVASTRYVDQAVHAGGFGTGTVTSFSKTDGFGIISSVANPTTTPNHTIRVDTSSTGLQTVLNFFPKGDTRYLKISSAPTGANPTASIGFTAVNGSASTFARSDGAPKADSTVIRSVANSYSLAGMQTKLNNYALTSSLPVGANPTATASTSAVNGSAATFMRSDAAPKVDSAVFRTVANSQTLAQTQTALNLKANLASPTFTGTVTIPNGGVFGTPTSMTATNVTGLPLTTGVTGLLPVANGGTNSSSVTTTPTTSAFAGWDANKNLSANAFIPGFSSFVTASGTTTLTVASPQVIQFTGTQNQTLVLPVASTLVQGQQYLILNNSTFTISVQSSGTNTVGTITSGTSAVLTCIVNSGTTAASWYFQFNQGNLLTASNAWTNTNSFSNNVSFTAVTTFNQIGSPNYNLYQSSSQDAVSINNSNYLFGGASNINVRAGAGGFAFTPAVMGANNNYANFVVGASPTRTAASGTHAWLANEVIRTLGANTSGGAAITNTASLYIEGQVATGTNNYALYVAAGNSAFKGPVILNGYTVSTLPTGITGMTAYVTDATAPTYNGTLTGGGAVTVPVFYNGSAWVSY